MARDKSPARLAFDRTVAAISLAYDQIKTWPPDPADLTNYARAMTAAREEYYNQLDQKSAK